jgi:hypothetical protein
VSRIMNEMLINGDLNMKSIKDYMAYTVKVCDLFRHFDRVSVLQYDREYRHLQCVYSFRWGTDAPHLHITCLRPKSRHPFKADSFNRGKTRTGDNTQPKEVCRLFNTYKGCPYRAQCKFIHRCNEPGCQQFHSRAQGHTAQQTTESND